MEELIHNKLQVLLKDYNIKITQDAFNLLCEFVKFHFTAYGQMCESNNSAQLAKFLRAFSVDIDTIQKIPHEYNLKQDNLNVNLQEYKDKITELQVQQQEFKTVFIKINQENMGNQQ